MKYLLKTGCCDRNALATLAACSPAKYRSARHPRRLKHQRRRFLTAERRPATSGTFTHDGVTFYYETYGEGEPLPMVHGNGASIGSLGKQIEHFKSKYKVIAMDSREQGKSGGNDKPIADEIMTDDLAALMDHLKTGPVDVIGWSDGGIEALMLGIRHPDKVKKLVATAANLNPTLEAIYPETDGMVKQIAGSLTPDVLATPAGKTQAKLVDLMANQPNIPRKALAAITAPTLVISGRPGSSSASSIRLPRSTRCRMPNSPSSRTARTRSRSTIRKPSMPRSNASLPRPSRRRIG